MLVIVVIVLGIIVAGGFLLYFLGDILMSMSKKKNRDGQIIKQKQEAEAKKLEERVNALENAQTVRENGAVATILFNGGIVEEYDPEAEELANAPQEETEETSEEEIAQEEGDVEVEDQPIADEEETEEAENDAEEEAEESEEDDVADYIARRRQELMEKLARIREDAEKDDNALDLEEEKEEMAETAEESAEETDQSNEEFEEEEVVEQPEEQEVEETQVAAEENAETTAVVVENIEELQARLAEAQEKLKANEKELRKCKKEYIPLRKVKNTLVKDENKLRRKEALVAKQKVVLYGVNNYADIDEEKAKKLAEDLDLLDGLKLSVQHCQEVMENNKERYPLLEQIYNLLVSKNTELKEEVKKLQDAISGKKSDEE